MRETTSYLNTQNKIQSKENKDLEKKLNMINQINKSIRQKLNIGDEIN